MTVDTTTGEIDRPMNEDEARNLTTRIRSRAESLADGIERLVALIAQAQDGQAHLALGYASWTAYVSTEFADALPRLDMNARREITAELRQRGMSTRAIGPIVGSSQATVRRDIEATESYGSVEQPETVTSLDGRQRPASRPEPIYEAELVEETPRRTWSDAEQDLAGRLRNGETVVVNMRDEVHGNLWRWAVDTGLAVRIDRKSDWGNPFLLPDDGDRDAVIRNYAERYLPHKPSLTSRLEQLRGRALGCWCAPQPCHGDVLKARAEE